MRPWPQRRMIFIYGSTGVGKSAFALALGKFLPIEIINADMGQLYVPLTIGTAKPDWLHTAIPHHLFDILEDPVDYSVIAYREAVIKIMEEVWQRGNIPVLVGGSGFYLHALLFPPQASACHKDHDEEVSWELLASIDPERAKSIHPNDTYRIARALSIWRTTGKKPSQFQRPYDPPAPFVLLNVERERQELYRIINERALTMLASGWLAECKQLIGTPWEPFIRRKKLIGYNEIFDYLYEKYSYEETIALIQQKTRNYAKRQQTFWKMFERQVTTAVLQNSVPSLARTVNLTFMEARLYINQLIDDLTTIR